MAEKIYQKGKGGLGDKWKIRAPNCRWYVMNSELTFSSRLELNASIYDSVSKPADWQADTDFTASSQFLPNGRSGLSTIHAELTWLKTVIRER